MREHGFLYVAGVPAHRPKPVRDFPYGIDDPAWAASHGFGTELARIAAERAARNPNQLYFRGLSDARKAAYQNAMVDERSDRLTVNLPNGYQVSTGREGCLAEARDALYGDYGRWYRATTHLENIKIRYQPRIFDDVRYRSAVKNWSTCMHRHGYQVKDLGELHTGEAAPDDRRPTRAQSDRERKAAVAEAECARDTALVTTAKQLETRYKVQALTALRDEIADRDELVARALPRARALIAQAH
ncbi:hypothetical protein ACWD6R_00895 [Streptomyces sp. NPDC005151]